MRVGQSVGKALVKLRLREAQPELTRDQALDAVPVRNPALVWRETDTGDIVITVPRREGRTWGLLAWVFAVPQTRDLTLDEIGSHVWNLCDGERSVRDLVASLVAEYRLTRREVEASLTQYLRDLGKRGMIGFAVPKAEERAGAAAEAPEERGAGTAPASEDQPTLRRRRSGRKGRSSRRRT
jgi:hypothetical protein